MVLLHVDRAVRWIFWSAHPLTGGHHWKSEASSRCLLLLDLMFRDLLELVLDFSSDAGSIGVSLQQGLFQHGRFSAACGAVASSLPQVFVLETCRTEGVGGQVKKLCWQFGRH